MTDSPELLMADMATDPETRAILDRQLAEEAENFVALALEYALRIKHMPDVWAARRILVDAKLWLIEAKKRADKEIAAHKEPKGTTKAFRR